MNFKQFQVGFVREYFLKNAYVTGATQRFIMIEIFDLTICSAAFSTFFVEN